MTALEIVGVCAFVVMCLSPLRGKILCLIGWHRWGDWHSYKLPDLERIGKARTYRWCMRFGCEATQDGPVCR